MNKYRVTLPYIVYVQDEVEAENEEEALEIACSDITLSSYVGNGSIDRLVGVTSGSVEASCEPLYDEIEIGDA